MGFWFFRLRAFLLVSLLNFRVFSVCIEIVVFGLRRAQLKEEQEISDSGSDFSLYYQYAGKDWLDCRLAERVISPCCALSETCALAWKS